MRERSNQGFMMGGMNPLNIPCSWCYAAAGTPCGDIQLGRWERGFHFDRVRDAEDQVFPQSLRDALLASSTSRMLLPFRSPNAGGHRGFSSRVFSLRKAVISAPNGFRFAADDPGLPVEPKPGAIVYVEGEICLVNDVVAFHPTEALVNAWQEQETLV